MPQTLLTGANGFVAAHILDQLITAGHSVTGSVRSAAKGEQILKAHPEYTGNFDFVVVSDYAAEGTWDETFQTYDFDYIIHTAAPLLDNPDNKDFDEHFLRPSVSGNIELLQSAQKHGKSIKSIAVTGSVNAMTTGADVSTRTFTSASWLPVSIEDARAANHPYVSYCVAKAEADKAIWAFMKKEKPHFTVSVLLPALIFGPPIQPITSVKKMNYSTDRLYELFNGTLEVVPPTSFGSYIDVRDLATAHIASLTTPSVANARFLIGGHAYSSALAISVLRTMPELIGRLPMDPATPEVPPQVKMGDVQEWNEKLSLKLRTVKETFGDAARRILQLEKSLEM